MRNIIMLFLGFFLQLVSMLSFFTNNDFLGLSLLVAGVSLVFIGVANISIKANFRTYFILVSLLLLLLVSLDKLLGMFTYNYLVLAILVSVVLLSTPFSKRRKLKVKVVKMPPKKGAGVMALKNSSTFHDPKCMTLTRSDKEDLTYFPSRGVAMSKGYKPCRLCNP